MMEQSTSPVFCALDTPDPVRAAELARSLGESVAGVKLGLEFFSATGPKGVETIQATGLPVFLDLKLHDIPNTVAKAVTSLLPLSPQIMTVHAAGGPEMMRAAAGAAAAAENDRPLIVGVTVLTSLDVKDLQAVGINSKVEDQVLRMARLAESCGLDGIVCSPLEIATLRQNLDPGFKLIVPGIRPAGSAKGDQKRIMTPEEAVALGADYLVIGRPITDAPDPSAAARQISETILAAA